MVRQERGALQTRLPVILLKNEMKGGGERREGGSQQAGKQKKQKMQKKQKQQMLGIESNLKQLTKYQ